MWKLQPRAGQFFAGELGGLMRGFCPPRQARCGPRAEGAHVGALQQAAFISNIFIGFSAEIVILQIIGARWTRAG